MLWQGAGSPGADGKTDPTSGQESILGAFSGQIIRQATFAGSGLTVDMQNHTVIYYDAVSATMLNKLWANPFAPNRQAVSFPEGAMVVKAAGVTPTPEQWPVLEGSADLECIPAAGAAAHRPGRQSEIGRRSGGAAAQGAAVRHHREGQRRLACRPAGFS